MSLTMIAMAQKALQNKHTTGAAVAYSLATFGCPIIKAWFPAKAAAIDATAKYLEAAAVFYGFAAAGDGAKSAADHQETLTQLENIKSAVRTGDTAIITKPPEETKKP